ncbi:MAG: phosphatase PAP2 family protein [Candidatus Saccharibacteria bacterium]
MKPYISIFDVYWTKTIQSLPKSFAPVMKAATMVGQPVIMGIIIAIFDIIALSQGLTDDVMLYSLVLVIIPFASILKIWVHRPRPMTYTRTWMPSHSFPSGHAYGSLLVLLTLAYVNASVPLFIFAILASFLIGLSRIYRGAHYPTDIIGGWIFALAAFILAVYFRGRI